MRRIDLRDKEKQPYDSPKVEILDLKMENVIAVSPLFVGFYFSLDPENGAVEKYEW